MALSCVSLLLITSLSIGLIPLINEGNEVEEKNLFEIDDEKNAGPRLSGVDVHPTKVKFSYPNSVDQDKYKMFSSNHPIANFNRPELLFVIDGMKGIDLQFTITVNNSGNNPSGNFNTQIKIMHDEYDEFILLDTLIATTSINPGSFTDITYTWAPTYSGNHSMQIITQISNDDNTGNDMLSRHITIGVIYDNCDDLSLWTIGSSWSSNSDAAISSGKSCHIGNGASSNYANNLNTYLTSPVFDFSNRHPNPTRAIGWSFFATGAGESNDGVSIQLKRDNGQWEQIGGISGSIDPLRSSWNTNTNTVASQTLPLMPMNVNHLHANSQFRMQFTSDASGTNVGYWIDDLVMYYDEIAMESEFDWQIGQNNQSSARRGYWTDQLVTIHNNGNASDRFLPTVTGIPSDWEVSFLHESGGGINSLSGVMVLPGESHNIRVRIKPGENASIGPAQYNLKVTSSTYSSNFHLKQLSIDVDPDFIPEIQEMESTPSCAPGNTCEFFVGVKNIGDASDSFDLSTRNINIRNGWTIGLSWSQVSPINIAPGNTEMVKFVVSVPADAEPDLTSTIWFDVNSFSDPTREDSQIIEAKAAMVSNAEVGINPSTYNDADWSVIPGDSKDIVFTIWNNASRQDVFDVGVIIQGGRSWNISQPSVSSMAVNPSSFATFSITVTAPTTGQANDPGPILTPYATSTRSGTNATSVPFSNLLIAPQYDLVLREIFFPSKVEPGVATAYSVEIENDGNGIVDAIITIPNIPMSWQWWMIIDDENHTGPISLTPSYEMADKAVVDIMILLPPDEEPNEEFELQVIVSPANGGNDLSPANNILYVTTLTAQVKRPEIVDFKTTQRNLLVGETGIINFEVHNIGNVGDPNLRVKAQLQTMPSTTEVELMLINLDNPSITASESNWIDMAQPARGIGHLQLRVILSDETPLNTNIAITIIVEGGDNGNGFPITLNEGLVIVVNERRDVNVEMTYESSTAKEGSALQFSFTAWSNSSVLETLQLTPVLPEGWNLECDGLVVAESIEITLIASDGMRPTSAIVQCSIINEGEITNGDVSWNLKNQEGDILIANSESFSYSTAENDETSALDFLKMDMKVVAVIVVILVFSVVMTLLILSKKRRSLVENEDDIEEGEEVNQYTVESDVLQPQLQSLDPLSVPSTSSELTHQTTQTSFTSAMPLQTNAEPTQIVTTQITDSLHPTPVSQITEPEWTDEQLLASGWTLEQIQQHRNQGVQGNPEQEGKSLDNAFSAL